MESLTVGQRIGGRAYRTYYWINEVMSSFYVFWAYCAVICLFFKGVTLPPIILREGKQMNMVKYQSCECHPFPYLLASLDRTVL